MDVLGVLVDTLESIVSKNSSESWRSSYQRESRFIGTSNRVGEGIVFCASTMRDCPGVRAVVSSGSSVRGCSGRELRHAFTCTRKVDNSSYVSVCSPMTLRRWCFTDFTPASHNPPKYGAEGGLNCHLVPSLASAAATCWLCRDEARNMARSSASAPIKLVP